MSEKDLEKLFEGMGDSVINPSAKKRAMQAAMAEFQAHSEGVESVSSNEAEHNETTLEKKYPWYQGLFQWLRPTTKGNDVSRSNTMKKQHAFWLYGSITTASVVIFAGFITLRSPVELNSPTVLSQPESLENFDIQLPPLQAEKTSLTSAVPDTYDDVQQEAVEEEVVVAGLSRESAAFADKNNTEQEVVTLLARRAEQRTAKKEIASSLVASAPSVRAPNINQAFSKPAVSDQAFSDNYEPELKEDRERFEGKPINPVKRVIDEPVSTFSTDVDTASYSFVRRKLNQGFLPVKESVRVEELLNYFDYDYPLPKSKKTPFATHVMVGDSPWKAGNKLMHIGIKGYEIREQPKSNIVFLLDTSGSMSSADKLPLVKQSIELLMTQLNEDDHISIVAYASNVGTVLAPTPAKEKQKIFAALNNLHAGGSTAGGEGIKLAYQLAEQNFDKDAVNRIVLATDGDFNVGISDPERLKDFVEKKREKGIYLSVLGFGEGNYNDHMMQALAQNGNGVAAYIDTLSEAQKVLVHESTSALFPIAQDVKVQVEFNPATVAEYRLIGYETRHLNREDFNNDKVDAGDIGAGHTVTALYEITPVDADSQLISDGRYANNQAAKNSNKNNEYAFVKLRYKLPGETTSTLVEEIVPSQNSVTGKGNSWKEREFRFSAAVAGFGQLLTGGKYMGEWEYDDVIAHALTARGDDEYGYRNEFIQLVRKAKLAKPF